MMLRLDFGKKEALLQQETQFQKAKIEGLMAQLNEQNTHLSEKLELQKSELGSEVQERI